MDQYLPTQESLNAHPLPQWFDDSKFGIFIHWGPYSVPGFAPKGSIAKAFQENYDRAMTAAPYAEWYWNAIKEPESPTAQFHREHYGDQPYQAFRDRFLEGLADWDPAAWARSFRDAGAGYVVMVTKHHDGFCLWPTAFPSPFEQDWSSQRDIVGELAAAVRAEGMRFGVYYSGGVDWTYSRGRVRTLLDYAASLPGGAYPATAMAHLRELIDRYRPDILWNDIKWPTSLGDTFKLFADYYNRIPDGVVNDRWSNPAPRDRWMKIRPLRWLADQAMKKAIAKNPEMVEGFMPARIPHSDFRTPEYRRFDKIQRRKWESTTGIGSSFGYNRAESDADYMSVDQLLFNLVDAVSKNGNMLLNVGPRGEDARIPDAQLARLAGIGEWLRKSGTAIYGARPWDIAEAVTADDIPVRFTQSDGHLNMIILGRPTGREIVLPGLSLPVEGSSPVDPQIESITTGPATTSLLLKQPLVGDFGPVFRFVL